MLPIKIREASVFRRIGLRQTPQSAALNGDYGQLALLADRKSLFRRNVLQMGLRFLRGPYSGSNVIPKIGEGGPIHLARFRNAALGLETFGKGDPLARSDNPVFEAPRACAAIRAAAVRPRAPCRFAPAHDLTRAAHEHARRCPAGRWFSRTEREGLPSALASPSIPCS